MNLDLINKNTFNINMLILTKILQGGYYTIDNLVNLNVFTKLLKFQAGNTSDLWLNIVNVFDNIRHKTFKALLAHSLS